MSKTNRKYKDRLFRLIFGDEKNKKNTLSLYNVLNNSSYENEEELELTTIEDVLYIRMKNDLSFIIADTMNLYEQQSTHNPNMPLRGLMYFGNLYEKYLNSNGLSLHVKTQVKIPTPNYIVLYNGTENRPATEKLYLSSAFQTPDERNEFEWTATVINLNHPDNQSLLKRCKPLHDYTFLVSKIQMYKKTMPIKKAVDKAVTDCIAVDVLAEFLTAHRAEVLHVYLAEVDEDVLRKRLNEEGREDHLTELITKKVKAGKSLEQIAAEVEETPEAILPLYERIKAELQ